MTDQVKIKMSVITIYLTFKTKSITIPDSYWSTNLYWKIYKNLTIKINSNLTHNWKKMLSLIKSVKKNTLYKRNVKYSKKESIFWRKESNLWHLIGTGRIIIITTFRLTNFFTIQPWQKGKNFPKVIFKNRSSKGLHTENNTFKIYNLEVLVKVDKNFDMLSKLGWYFKKNPTMLFLPLCRIASNLYQR